MADPPEFSESGNPIYRHRPREREFELAAGDEASMLAITAHLERFLGPSSSVFHELLSDLVHLDVHLFPPTEERDFHVLVTTGMSDRPMNVPDRVEGSRYAEVMICLPRRWKLSQKAFKNDANYWPIYWLKTIARLPHEYDTWVGSLHTIPNGDPAEPFHPGIPFCCWLLLHPFSFGDGFDTIPVSANKTVRLLCLIPLFREEMDLKLKQGGEALLEKLADIGLTEVLDPSRPNVGKKKGWF